MSRAQKPKGRIRPFERDADDSGIILGSGLEVPPDLRLKCNETFKLQMSNNCRRDYRQRLKRIILFWKEENPLYYEIGVKSVRHEDLTDETKYFFHGSGRSKEGFTEDIIYAGLNVDYVLHFLASNKLRHDGKVKSFQDLRKYKDAILWGSETAGERLPMQFYTQIDLFLQAYKKEYQQAKKKGMVEETSADPITETLYKLLLKWSLDGNNVFVWFWTIAQWNFMARSASIDPLAFHNFSNGSDSIIGKYDDSKADKSGERLSEKNIYANPLDWRMCFWTGFGVWCCLSNQQLLKSERLFIETNVKEGSASTKYCEQLASIIQQHIDELKVHVNSKNFNPYGLRKGAATHAVSGTTAAPSIPAIARRGEWSIGSVLDVYWHFGSVGDQYLGRILAGMNPNHVSFATLPPHWIMTNPFGNEDIKRGMDITFPGILLKHPHIAPILLKCFASMIFHSEKMVEQMHRVAAHQFNKIEIFHEPMLLSTLRNLVTTDATEGVLTAATGIPPHIEMAVQIKQLHTSVSLLLEFAHGQHNQVISAINDAFENKAMESGHVTGQKVKELLLEFKKSTLEVVTKKMGELIATSIDHGQNQQTTTSTIHTNTNTMENKVNIFHYEGKWFAVPDKFKFPRVDLKVGLRFWLKGHSVEGNKTVRPYRKINLADLPPDQAATDILLERKVCNSFRLAFYSIIIASRIVYSVTEYFQVALASYFQILGTKCCYKATR